MHAGRSRASATKARREPHRPIRGCVLLSRYLSVDGHQDRETSAREQVTAGRDAYIAGSDLHVHAQAQTGLTQDLDGLYMRAIGHLGSKKATVRIGALHALSRLGQNHPSLRLTVIEMICAYLRMPYTAPEGASRTGRTGRPSQREELQVRLTAQNILAEHLRDARHGRHNDAPPPETFWPEIDIVDLAGASLVDLNLSGCRVRSMECHNAIFVGESLFREFICDIAFFQNAMFKGIADFRGAVFINSAWFSYSTFAADVWFHGDEFFPVSQFGRHASFIHARFARNASFEKVVFEGSADFDGVECEAGIMAINMRGCRINHPEAVNPDVSKRPSVWPPGWSAEIDLAGGATLQNQALPALAELLERLVLAADAQEFELILQGIQNPEVQPDAIERSKARREVFKSRWYDTIYRKFGDRLSPDVLSAIFQVVIIPDLSNSAIASEVAEWARYVPPAVIAGLLAAAKVSGVPSYRMMMDILEPALVNRWAAERDVGIEGATTVPWGKAALFRGKEDALECDVYLSYHWSDKDAVRSIAQQLRNRGLRPWMDERELRPGAPWQAELEEIIARVPAVAVIIGAQRGSWQKQEIYAFIQQSVSRGCVIVPVLLPDANTSELPVFLQGLTWVNLAVPEPDPIDQLFWGVTGQRL
jgi:nucleotide-binding universal stress UspA family protein/uncharacterized protein YjbI with pentapeptide repeats